MNYVLTVSPSTVAVALRSISLMSLVQHHWTFVEFHDRPSARSASKFDDPWRFFSLYSLLKGTLHTCRSSLVNPRVPHSCRSHLLFCQSATRKFTSVATPSRRLNCHFVIKQPYGGDLDVTESLFRTNLDKSGQAWACPFMSVPARSCRLNRMIFRMDWRAPRKLDRAR